MVSDKLKDIILSELDLKDFPMEDKTTAADVPGWDSINHINIILAVEKAYQIKFKGIEMMKVQNLNDMQKLIDSKLV
jgi:acyl carrier protein